MGMSDRLGRYYRKLRENSINYAKRKELEMLPTKAEQEDRSNSTLLRLQKNRTVDIVPL